MNRNNSNTADGVEKVDGGQTRDFGRGFGFGVLGFLILAFLVAFSIGTTQAATEVTSLTAAPPTIRYTCTDRITLTAVVTADVEPMGWRRGAWYPFFGKGGEFVGEVEKVLIAPDTWEFSYGYRFPQGASVGTYRFSFGVVREAGGPEIASKTIAFKVTGPGFVQEGYDFAIERAYDQRVAVPIQNDDVLPHEVQLSVSHWYEDLILDFIGPGSVDRPLTLGPGEGRNIILAIHAQDATAGSYGIEPLELRADGAEEPVSVAWAGIDVRRPLLDLAFEQVSENPHTLGKTIRLTNRGDELTDLTVGLGPQLAGKAMLRPLVEHFALATGATVEFDVMPMLSPDFTSLSGEVRARTALDSTAFTLEFTLSEGDQIFQALQNNMKVWERVKTWYCNNRPRVEVRFQTPPPSTPTNLLDAFLEVNFSLPWNRNAYRNHDVRILVNNHEVGALLNIIPHGKYLFWVDPSYINHGSGALNIVKFDTRHLNGGHYVVSADIRLLFHIPDYPMYVVADSQEEAEAFLDTYGIVGGVDLAISTDTITFSEEHPEAGASVTIAAALDNLAIEDAVDVLVRFYDGPPQNEEQIGTDLVIPSVPSQQRVPVETVWTIPAGNHIVYVVVDPEATITEIREDNNLAFRAISTANADVESPTVLSTSPGPGATDVGLEQAIRITFSEPMNQPTAEGAFSIAPEVSGAFDWEDHRNIILTPDIGLAQITTYTVTIDTSAEDLAGNGLVFDYRFAFTTETQGAAYTITATAGAHGSISPSGEVTVSHGADQTFTITPDTSYHVADVKVDGVSVGAVTAYTFTNVTADHTIEATFADTTAPEISGIEVSDITDSSATITWMTDEISSSLVQYDTTIAYSLTAEGADSVTSHRATLTGLSDSTIYHFRVGSTDPSGNTAWSQDSTFTTLAYREEAETTAILVVTGTVYRDGAPVEEELNVTVRNLATGSELSDLTGRTAGVGGYVVTFSDLAGNRAAAVGDTIEVTVYDAEGSVLGQASHTVTADEIAASLARIDITLLREEDTVPPQISEVSVLDITSTSATATWITDEPSSSVVEYGTTTAYGLSAAGADSVTSHRVTLTGLSASTIYHYRVGSTDVAGNGPTWSEDLTFETQAGPDTTRPVISEVTIADITDRSATITWMTDEISSSLVQYDTTTAYSLRAEGADSVTSHRVTLTGLSDSTTYHFRVGSTDPSGNTAWSQDSTFTTLAYREEAETTAIFVVTGTVYRDGAPVEEELNVTVRNLATESELSDLTGRTAGVGGYVVTFSDLAGNRAAAVGDTIEVTVYDAEGSVLGQAMHLVTADEIAASLARIDITLPGEEDTVPPQISEVSVLDITSTSATVTWTTDEPSSSVVEYGTTTAYGLSAAGADSVTSHRVTLTGLSDFTIYHFRVGSTDPSGNTAWSQDSTFTTLAYREEAETTAILVVTGTVYRDGAPVEEELTVTVRNLATGSKLSDLTGRTAGVGGYVVTFSDVAGNRAAAVGDTIEMTVYDAEGSVLGQAMHQVTADEIAASLARIDVTLPAVEELAGDFNKDGWVWTEDFVMFVTQFGRQQGDEGFDPIYDLDQDGWVWTDDFAIFVAQFGKTSGTAKTVAELPPVGKNHNAEVSVSVHTRPTLLSSEDREFTVELSVENAAELRGYGLTLDYDPQVLEFLGATPGKDNLLNRAGGSTPLFLVVSNPDKPGQIWIANALADSKLAQGDGLLASFSFRNRGKLSGSSLPISLSAVKLFDARLHLNSISAESVMRQIQLVPEQNRLAQNYPNPFNAVTSISYQLAQPAFVTLEVYNLSGQLVKTLITDEKPAGWHSARWDGRDSSGGTVASGIYFYHLSAGEFSKVHKMLLLK